MKILIVTPFPPCSGRSGGAAAVFKLVNNLVPSHSLICLTFARAEDLSDIAEIRRCCEQIITVPLPGGAGLPRSSKLVHLIRRVMQNLLSLLTLTPVAVLKSRRHSMADALKEAIKQYRPDIVHICFPQMAQYVDACQGLPTVMDTQDVAVVSAYRRAVKAFNPLARVYHFLQWLFWIRHESRLYPQFGKVLTLTQQDAAALRIYCPQLDIYPGAIGIEIPRAFSESRTSSKKIGFLANFSHPPNADAASYFARDIFPLIRKQVPAAEFIVAGRNPPGSLLKLAGDGVQFAGFVEDVNVFYAGMDIVVAPLRFGGGIKIKVLEALACARPVVATSVGAEGIAVQEDNALLIADDPHRFAACVCQLLNSASLAQELGTRGQALVKHKFSWQRVVGDLGDIYANLAQENPDLERSKNHPEQVVIK